MCNLRMKHKWFMCSDLGPSPKISHYGYANILKYLKSETLLVPSISGKKCLKFVNIPVLLIPFLLFLWFTRVQQEPHPTMWEFYDGDQSVSVQDHRKKSGLEKRVGMGQEMGNVHENLPLLTRRIHSCQYLGESPYSPNFQDKNRIH